MGYRSDVKIAFYGDAEELKMLKNITTPKVE